MRRTHDGDPDWGDRADGPMSLGSLGSDGRGGRAAHHRDDEAGASSSLDRSHRSSFISARRGISLSSASSQRLPAAANRSSSASSSDPRRSLSGNPLHTVRIAEDADVELDREEMRRLVASVREGEDAIFDGEHMRMFHDGSTLGTTASALRAMGESEHGTGGSVRPRVEIDGAPDSYVFQHSSRSGMLSDDHKRLRSILFSPPVRRLVALGLLSTLVGLSTLLTLVNVFSVRTAADWTEPRTRNRGTGGGLDWSLGPGSPPAVSGAVVRLDLERNLADWAGGTVRLVPGDGDGAGGVTLSERSRRSDVPYLWTPPYAGGAALEDMVGQCLNLVVAAQRGGLEDRESYSRLKVVTVLGRKYLNVDLFTSHGIRRAADLGLSGSGMADLVVSPLLDEALGLFSPGHRGRLLVVVRHPAERELAMFRYLRAMGRRGVTTRDELPPSASAFASSDFVSENWMTRSLAGKRKGEAVTARDVEAAKEVLRRKALVGLYEDLPGAARRYARYFGWDGGAALGEATASCLEGAAGGSTVADAAGADDPDEGEGSDAWRDAWRELERRNGLDMELYLYARNLFKFQSNLT